MSCARKVPANTQHFPDGLYHVKKKHKICTGECHQDKPIEMFAKKSRALDGHESQCIECTRIRATRIRERRRENNFNAFI